MHTGHNRGNFFEKMYLYTRLYYYTTRIMLATLLRNGIPYKMRLVLDMAVRTSRVEETASRRTND